MSDDHGGVGVGREGTIETVSVSTAGADRLKPNAIGLWGVLQLISGLGVLGVEPGGGVAYWAHIGGFVAGLALVFVFGNRGAGQGIRLGQFGR